MHDIVGIAAPSDLGGTFYVSGDLYCCFKHFAKETTVKLQSTHAARVRRLINSSENCRETVMNTHVAPVRIPASADTETVAQVLPTTDPFLKLVSSRPSNEVNPHLWTWQAEALDAWHAAGCRGVVEAVTGPVRR